MRNYTLPPAEMAKIRHWCALEDRIHERLAVFAAIEDGTAAWLHLDELTAVTPATRPPGPPNLEIPEGYTAPKVGENEPPAPATRPQPRTENRRAAERRYQRSEKGRRANKRAAKRYRKSEKGRATRRAYRKRPEVREQEREASRRRWLALKADPERLERRNRRRRKETT